MSEASTLAETGVVWKGPADLRGLLVPIDEAQADPANPNDHPEDPIVDLMVSYDRFGQQKPIAVGQDDFVSIAGSGTIEALRRLGWTHIAACRSDLEGMRRTEFKIADNALARRAEWSSHLGDMIEAIAAEGGDVEALGFTPEQLEEIVAGPEARSSVELGRGGPVTGGAYDDDVDFRFGEYGARVPRDLYDRFRSWIDSMRAERPDALLADLLEEILDSVGA